jgi:hypothetical protein
MLKIGDTIYKFDENHRVYRKGPDGRATGGPIYAEYFVPYEIKGETKQSWLTGYMSDIKVNKKTLRSAGQSGFSGHQWFTAESKDAHLWVAEHRRGIERALLSATVDQLKRIAEIVGYVPDNR